MKKMPSKKLEQELYKLLEHNVELIKERDEAREDLKNTQSALDEQHQVNAYLRRENENLAIERDTLTGVILQAISKT